MYIRYGCEYYNNDKADDNTEHYVHGEAEGIKNAVIECNMEEITVNGEEEKKYKASCRLIEDPLSKNVYISTYNQKQIIICSNTEYPENKINSLIKCSYNDKCVTVEEYDEFENENQVFLNSNFGKADDENQLIKLCKEKLIEYTDEKTEYTFVNAGKENEGGIIKCYKTINEGKCTVSELGKEETFIDDNTGQLIVCDENGCKPKSTGASTDIIDGEKICKKVVPIPTIDDGVFIDSSNPNQIIYCDGNKCYSKPSTADDDKPQYFINGDSDSDLIECRKNGEKITCKAINGNDATTISGGFVDSDENPQYFVNTGNKNSNKMKDALIVCVKSVCELQDGSINDVYVNSDEETKNDKPLIKCEKLGCSIGSSGATKGNNEIYINAGKDEGTSSDNTSSKKGIIECSIDSSNKK
ncbi:hypothetical protein LY90DRAFT_520153 [Neocallimastix californiae]|uniref:Scaffoldin n=1 Tax=Neocallimastix californiae TaxID=1754190 RepID=A0A1Y1YFZ4_9FUNG|nr:hypothetical protein LY90DRAFT_520153 [Neocallimastix californiae]|eukprot:ORX96950.1 hypothetical protein LY90DRAFT_520153 [Neocallimastix californiae]